MREFKEIKNEIWNTTTGKTYLRECDIETKDEGETFFCKTHNKTLFCGVCEDKEKP